MNHNMHVRRLKTVKVKADNDLGYMLINESDFDEKKHKLYDAKPAKKAKKKADEPTE